jgi:hypothetical protein
LTADDVKNDMHIKMFIKKDRTRERIEIECVYEKMTTTSNTHSQCSATYQPNLHSMGALADRQWQYMHGGRLKSWEKKKDMW